MRDYVLAASSVFRGEVVLDPKEGFNRKVSEDEAMVCLTCTKKKCFGEVKCFNKRKKEMQKGGGG